VTRRYGGGHAACRGRARAGHGGAGASLSVWVSAVSFAFSATLHQSPQATPQRGQPVSEAAAPATPAAHAPPQSPFTPGAAAALGCATDVATSLRAERAALLAQLQSSESRWAPGPRARSGRYAPLPSWALTNERVWRPSRPFNSRAVTQLTAQLAAERSARFHEEVRTRSRLSLPLWFSRKLSGRVARQLLLRSELASLQAERDTLAARVATLERERAQTAELFARRACAAPGPSPDEPAAWFAWGAAKHSAAPEAALAAVRLHLVTVTTDRDLLAVRLLCKSKRTVSCGFVLDARFACFIFRLTCTEACSSAPRCSGRETRRCRR